MPLPTDEPDIPRDDGTPTLARQCEANGWDFGFYDFGLGDNGERDFFNPTIVERPDGLWLLTRVSQNHDQYRWGINSTYAFQLNETGKVPKAGYKLEWPESVHGEQHEDARAVYYPRLDQTAVCCTNFVWYDHFTDPPWTGALQVMGFFDSKWECRIKHRPAIGGNPDTIRVVDKKNYEKSWMPFFSQDRLHIFYSSDPWKIYRFGETWDDRTEYHSQGITWKHGTIRNGTPPVLVGDEFISIFHSSLPWRGNYRRYFAGAVAFEAKPPFTPRRITPEPLLAGSQQDPWSMRKPPCVFPCGALLLGKNWFITAGVNDIRAAWIEIPHESLLSRLEPIGSRVTPIFPPSGLSEQESRRERLRANLVKARAARSAKAAKRTARRKKRQQAAVVLAEDNLAPK